MFGENLKFSAGKKKGGKKGRKRGGKHY